MSQVNAVRFAEGVSEGKKGEEGRPVGARAAYLDVVHRHR